MTTAMKMLTIRGRSPSNDAQVAALVFPQVGGGGDGEEYKEYTSRSFTYHHHASLAQVVSGVCDILGLSPS